MDPDFYEVIDAVNGKEESFKVFYFDEHESVQDAIGITMTLQKTSEGEFLVLENKWVRLDRIITLNGKVGPSYEAYDAYANACLSCQAGYDS
ncbi:MAG: hypothetical protein HRT61_05380 [Ekhidna sp.]|nr:hypothetical protein [Ekhidna sp.]